MAFLRRYSTLVPEVGLILGSGLGSVAASVEAALELAYSAIPHFPQSTVAGHAGRLVLGRWHGKTVLVFQGRLHYYEGYSLSKVTLPVRVAAALGAKFLFLTNAAGSLRADWQVGELMLIKDHLNFLGDNPLRGLDDARFGPRFPDLVGAYDADLRRYAREAALAMGLALREGTYAAVSGPSYETPAEAAFLRLAGADAVGMSTVPEVIVARQAGLRVLAVSCLTNVLAGAAGGHTVHEQVVQRAAAAADDLARLLAAVVARL